MGRAGKRAPGTGAPWRLFCMFLCLECMGSVPIALRTIRPGDESGLFNAAKKPKISPGPFLQRCSTSFSRKATGEQNRLDALLIRKNERLRQDGVNPKNETVKEDTLCRKG